MKVLKFGAVWCPGCLVMKPRWAEVEREHAWLKTEFYDFDQNKDVVETYHVDRNLPVCIFLDGQGHELTRLHGEVEKERLVALIQQYRNA
ncbi:MAG: thioredoxin family protein [Candidatus Peribacteraceae bacterium]|nr:thioredoxin family protein [Candidatus Peribacteraceae bacterium]